MGNTLPAEQLRVILVRHGSRDVDSNIGEAEQAMVGWNPQLERVQPSYKEKGLPLTLAIANRVLEELKPIKIAEIWHSPHTVFVRRHVGDVLVGVRRRGANGVHDAI
jgi:hypothetical protein